jgi:hypothetical protein
MNSGSDRVPSNPAELRAFEELRQLVRRVSEELATFRRRAHAAEARVRDVEALHAGEPVSFGRVEALERENAELRRRLAAATSRTRDVLDQVRFIRQQSTEEVEK